VFPTTLSGAVAPTANSGSVQATLLNKLTFPVGRSSTNPADQTVYGLVIDSSGNLHVTVSGAATQFSTTITVTNTGGASAVFAPNWPGYVASNATLTTSIFSQTCAVGNSGGATIVCDPNAAQVDITFGLGRAVVTTTQFAIAAFGGSETAMVLPTGTTEVTLAVGGAISTTGLMYDGTVSGRATKGEGMLIRSGQFYRENEIAYSETGTTRYIVSAGPETLQAQGAVKVESVVCVSDISMAKAAAGNGQILRWGQTYRLPGQVPHARTLYAAIVNSWVPNIPTVTLSISQN
jgi:hypothetical protein